MNNLDSLRNAFSKGFARKKEYPIEKESTQNPALEPGKISAGTKVPYAEVIPTGVEPFDPLRMNPVNGEHWKHYVADTMLDKGEIALRPNPSHVYAGLSEPQQVATAGSHDVWKNYYHLTLGQSKGYYQQSYH